MKRLTAIAASAVLATAGLALGDYPPSVSSPAGYPPTTQFAPQFTPEQSPGSASQMTSRAAPRVAVFPFESVGNPGPADWVGRGLQASLQSDVSHTGAMLLMAPANPGADPVAAAKSAGANLVVTGTYQVQGDTVRADGHLIDTATGQPVGGFSGKAPLGSVFQLEDAMGTQLQRLLPLQHPAPQPVASAY